MERHSGETVQPRSLICLPYLGGNAGVFSTWQSRLGPAVQVIAVELPGRGRRLEESPLTSVMAIAADVVTRYAPAFAGPYALYGHSFGAYVAFEVACLLSRDLGIPPSGLIVGACPPPPAQQAEFAIHLGPDAALEEYVRWHAGTPEEVFDSPELRAVVMRTVRADLEALETYTVRPGVVLDTRLTAISGSADPEVTPAAMLGWRAFTRGSFDRRYVDGDHFFVQRSADALIDVLRDVLVSADAASTALGAPVGAGRP